MRVCPVCNESFGDEFRFCELDGSRLERQLDDPSAAGNKGWSFLGVGLLVGAIILSVSIFFLPKRRVTPIASSSTTASQAVSAEPAAEGTGSAAALAEAAASTDNVAVAAAEQSAALDPKKKKSLGDSELSPSSLNPKAAFKTEETSDAATPIHAEPSTATPAKTEPPAPVKPSDSSAGDLTTDKATADAKANPKHTGTATTKEPDKQNGKKKDNDEKDKKKGGFLRVFKKIFGKD